MANTFKSILYEVTGSDAVFYTCPAATTTIVIGAQAANKSNAGPVLLDIEIYRGAQYEYLVYDVVIPQDASLAPITGKLVLEAGDQLLAKTGVLGDVSLVMSILEIT